MRPIPTIVELEQRISNDIKNKFNLSSNVLKKVFKALSIVFAALFKLLYYFLSDVQNNVFPDTADSESVGGTLERQGRIYLGRNPFPASSGVFNLSVTGNAGAVIRSGLTFKSNDDSRNPGQLYVTDTEYTLTGTDDIIEARSLGGGADFVLNNGDNLTITEPVLGINQTVTVDETTTQPTAAEDLEVYRQLVIDAIQLEPQGGAKTDYRLWASDAQGVRKVYPYVRNGSAGLVDVYVEATPIDSTDGNGTPSGGLLTEVAAVIEFDPDETRPLNDRGRRPMTAIVTVLPIDIVPVDVFVTGLDIDTVAIQSAIKSNLTADLYKVRPFIGGADLQRNKNDILYSARLQSVITNVLDNGNYFIGFDMQVDGNSVSSYLFDLGNIPYLRNVSINGSIV